MKVTKQKICINNVNEIKKWVINFAFGTGYNASFRAVIPRDPHNKNKTRIGTWKVRTMGPIKNEKRENGQYRERDKENTAYLSLG